MSPALSNLTFICFFNFSLKMSFWRLSNLGTPCFLFAGGVAFEKLETRNLLRSYEIKENKYEEKLEYPKNILD